VNTAYVFAAGAYIGSGWSWRLLIGTLYFSLPFNLLLYGVNDLFDYATDVLNPRKQSIEGGLLRPQRRRATWTAIAVSDLPFLLVLFATSSPRAAVALAFVLFTAYAYSAPPLRWKEVPLLDSFTSATHFVTPLVFGVLYGRAGLFPWPEVVAFTLWAMASQAFGAIQDIGPDRAAGVGSIATVFGERRTALIALVFYALALTIVLLARRTLGYLLVGVALAVYPLSVLLYLVRPAGDAAHQGWRRFLWLNMATGATITIAFISGR
jgi:4-hydroxybenzoate polyprenyltransferase